MSPSVTAHPAQQLFDSQDLIRLPVTRRLPTGIAGLAGDQDSALIGDRLDRHPVRLVTDNARLRQILKLSLRQFGPRSAVEFEQRGLARVEWMLAFAANPAQ